MGRTRYSRPSVFGIPARIGGKGRGEGEGNHGALALATDGRGAPVSSGRGGGASRRPGLPARAEEAYLLVMILTPILPEKLGELLDRFMADLVEPLARAVFEGICATSPDRAVGTVAEQHRQAALALARGLGMRVHPDGAECKFNWDGTALDGATEAYVILHEIAHYMLAPPARRQLIDFGLGPGPDTRDREAANRAAVLSPLRVRKTRRPPHCSGSSGRPNSANPPSPPSSIRIGPRALDARRTSISPRCSETLRRRGLLTRPAEPGTATADREGRAAAAKTVKPGCQKIPCVAALTEWAEAGLSRRPE